MALTGFADPRATGGSFLTTWADTVGHGEPLNVVLSAASDPAVLKDSTASGGFQMLMLSAFMAKEFLGLHRGAPQRADLGDGQGMRDQTRLLRYDYGEPFFGTGFESLAGGNHLRYWVQQTTGAYFLAVSKEEPLKKQHDIVKDGYDIGRDMLVGDLVGAKINTTGLKPGDRFEGESSYQDWTFHTVAEYVGGLLERTSIGINHAETVGGGGPAIDGLVAVITSKVVSKPGA